jgi:hypothetical protein
MNIGRMKLEIPRVELFRGMKLVENLWDRQGKKHCR